MSTKTCKKCGWVLAYQDPSNICPICKTRFDVGICRECGSTMDPTELNKSICRACYNAKPYRIEAEYRMRKRRVKIYEEWLDKIKKVPKNYPALTEDQWLEAVKYFNGCALCEGESIDSRGYFVPFKYGGRYCDWNIIPVCEKCALRIKVNPNYFIENARPKGLLNIISYLEEKLNGAIAKIK